MEFQLKENTTSIELVKLLKVSGVALTGGQGKILIGNGEVKVNGVVETRKKAQIKKGYVVEVKDITIEII